MEDVEGPAAEHRAQQSPSGQGYSQLRNNNDRGDRGQKRSYYDRDKDGGRGDSQGGPGTTSSRGFKAPRRGTLDRVGGSIGRWGARADMTGPANRGGAREVASSPIGMPYPSVVGFGVPPAAMPPAFPWPEDPTMAALLAMQAATAWTGIPGFPPVLPPAVPPAKDVTSAVTVQRKPVERKVGERCKDYDEKGYCMQGDMCPYEHGMDHIVISGQPEGVSDEYDPNNSQLFPTALPTTQNGGPVNQRGGDRGRGRGGRGRGAGTGAGGRGGRSEISGTGPNYDKSNSTLVVEHIPEEKLDESSIRAFFGTFGTVVEVTLQPWKKFATVKFERWDMAKKAYDSPAPIFDNRFVKVFWYKPQAEANATTQLPVAGGGGNSRVGGSPPPQLSKLADEEVMLDLEEFKRKTEEAQKAHEEKMKKKKEHEERMKELERKKGELLKMEMEQKRILMEKLAKRKFPRVTGGAAGKATAIAPSVREETIHPTTTNGAAITSPETGQTPPELQSLASVAPPSSANLDTEALRAQLEALEAEAKSLGIDHPADPYSTSYSARGRGTFRARAGSFRGATRGVSYHSPYVPPGAGKPYVSGYRGRGVANASKGRGGAMRLDNRPKRVSVRFGVVEGADEALRQYLLVN